MFVPMKCSRPQDIRAYPKYLRLHKIYAPHQECSRLIIFDSNKAAVEIFAAYERCMRPRMYAPKLLLFGLGRISNFWLLSVWLKSSRSDDVASPPCSPQVGICSQTAQLIWAASLPYCTGLLYRHDLPNFRALSNVGGREYFPLFSGKNQKPNSAHKCPITSVQIRT